MSDDEEVPPESLFFKKRAKLVPHVSAEDFQSVSEQMSKADESKEKPTEKNELVKPAERAKTRSKKRKLDGSKCDASKFEVLTDPPDKFIVSRVVKNRLKKLKEAMAREAKLVEIANQKVLSAAESPVLNEVEEVESNSANNFVILTVSYMSERARLRCSEHEKFATIFPKVADLFRLKASELLLCLGEQNIKVEDTPKSLNITLADTIECIPYKADGNHKGDDDDDDKLKLIFQSGDSKRKEELSVHKLEKMQDIMEKYSQLRKICIESLIFEFDGEKIEGTETPEDLGMESGHCIDVKVQERSTVKKGTAHSTKSKVEVVTLNSDAENSSSSSSSIIYSS